MLAWTPGTKTIHLMRMIGPPCCAIVGLFERRRFCCPFWKACSASAVSSISLMARSNAGVVVGSAISLMTYVLPSCVT